MGNEECKQIKETFAQEEVTVTYQEHEEVRTSQEAADIRGMKLEEGIKAIVFTNNQNEWVVTDVPADHKVNMKAVADKMHWSKNKMRMATPDEVYEKTGCVIGSVPPFGHKEKIPILVDTRVFDHTENSFNIGLRTHSAIIKSKDMKKVFDSIHAEYGTFAKK